MNMVFCRGCGKEIEDSILTCPYCGGDQGVMPKQIGAKIQSSNKRVSTRLKIVIGVILAITIYLPYGIYMHQASNRELADFLAYQEIRSSGNTFKHSYGEIIYTRELHAAKKSFGLYNLVRYFSPTAAEVIAEAVTGWSRYDAEQADRQLAKNARELNR